MRATAARAVVPLLCFLKRSSPQQIGFVRVAVLV